MGEIGGEFQRIVKEQLNVNVTVTKCQRTRDICNKVILGDYMYEFSRLWSYAAEIGRSNPGSTVRIKTTPIEGETRKKFQRIYICLDVLRGFSACCRPVIGLDGCFLKGMLQGQLLVAVSQDGNNQMYPFAWAVVKVENKSSWTWFLELLKQDVNTPEGAGYTLISDQQKGLRAAVNELWPHAEHRFCARHIYANWRKRNPGIERKKLFWYAAKSTTIQDFNEQMEKIDKKGMDELVKKGLHYWCQAFFSTGSKCDIVDNNLTEAFNSSAVEACHMSIISMLERLRVDLMKRIIKKANLCLKWQGDFGRRIMEILKDDKEYSRYCHIGWGDKRVHKVFEGSGVYVVKWALSTCTCRRWDLTGIPCKHAIASIKHEPVLEINRFMHPWYKKEMYYELYANYRIEGSVSDRF